MDVSRDDMDALMAQFSTIGGVAEGAQGGAEGEGEGEGEGDDDDPYAYLAALETPEPAGRTQQQPVTEAWSHSDG